MIVICPACQIRYLVGEDAVSPDGERSLRCPSCLHLWQYSAEGAAIQATLAEFATSARENDGGSIHSRVSRPRASVAPDDHGPARFPADTTTPGHAPISPEMPTSGRRRPARIGVLGVSMLVFGAVIVAIIAHDRLTATLPSAAPALRSLRLTEAPGAGLEISSVLTRADDSLTITGDIINKTKIPRPVPRLRLTLRDGNQRELESAVIDPPVDQLMPATTTHFEWTFEHPSIAATGIAVQFTGD